MSNDGLSTATFIDGAMRGVNFVEGMRDRQQMRGLRDAQSRRADRGMAIAEERHQMAKEQHGTEQKIQGIRIDQMNDQVIQQMNQTLADQLINADKLTPEQKQLIQAHPNLNANRILSDEYGKALQTVDRLMARELDLSSPEVAQAFDVLNPEIGIGASGGRKVKTKRIYPGKNPGTVMVGLTVEGDESERPLTERRSADDDDPVKEVPVDLLLQRAMAAKQYREMLSSPEGREWFIKTYSSHKAQPRAGELQKHPELGYIQEKPDGTYQQYEPPGAGGRGGTADPADYRLAKLIQREFANDGHELTFEQAWTKAKMAVSDPTKYVADYVKTRLEMQEFADPKDRKPPEQLEREGVESFRRIRKMVAGQEGGDVQPAVDEPTANPSQSPRGGRQAPAAAIEFLKKNPQFKDQFQAKYGYLPDGF